jgi:hypothetical protein
MPLKLYRRHRRECEASFPEGAFSGEYEESRRGAKRCSCIIHASGTLAGRFNRKQTGCYKWEEARAIARTWEAAGSWDGSKEPLQARAAAESAQPVRVIPARVSIADATDAYLSRCQNRGIRESTLAKYQTFVKQLRGYADLRGYFFVQQLTVAELDRFYASWKDGKRSRAKKLERLKSFVHFCLKRKWLSEDIAEDLEAPEGSHPCQQRPVHGCGIRTHLQSVRCARRAYCAGTRLPQLGRRGRKGLHPAIDLYRPSHLRCCDLRYRRATQRE